ncbi:hypothetical protein SPAR10_0545 [Streptococcus infantis SPAR10]|uniref:Uncharacterized protein n=1 Tax=Streptococcus infantis SPAR10 TaxID=1159208 RepID=J1GYR6_9STRE|nr:hypothetical protein SPAR10_0545 [Streptococcus infantis SPAR10]
MKINENMKVFEKMHIKTRRNRHFLERFIKKVAKTIKKFGNQKIFLQNA